MVVWVPEPPEPVSVRHLPDWGLTRDPFGWGVQVWAPVPLQPLDRTAARDQHPACLIDWELSRFG